MAFSAKNIWAQMVQLEADRKFGQLEILADTLTRKNLEALCRYGLKAAQEDMDDAESNQLWEAIYLEVQKDAQVLLSAKADVTGKPQGSRGMLGGTQSSDKNKWFITRDSGTQTLNSFAKKSDAVKWAENYVAGQSEFTRVTLAHMDKDWQIYDQAYYDSDEGWHRV